MKFLRESVDFNQVHIITEGTGADKSLFIEGIFAQAEKKNRNGRVYPKGIMENAVNRYVTEFVDARRALGELSHPESRPVVKPELASHLITQLRFEGNDVYGKAKVLNTPQGNVLRGLLEGGVQMGVSTRGLGSIEERAGTTYVKDDFAMMAIDAVSDPSGIDCWVNAINESRDWVYIDGRYEEREIEEAKTAIKKASKKELNEVFIKQFSKFMNTISVKN
jgi:Prohead core protein serine protease